MFKSRLLLSIASIATCGAVYAAISPALPFNQEMVTATAEHKMVMKSVGSWEGTMSMHMGVPEPTKAPCTEVITAVGDLWVTTRFEMDFMGMPFSGASSMGYDPEKEMFVGTWIDSMTPRLTIMEGKFDEEKNAIVMHYEMPDHETGEMMEVRSESVHGDDSYSVKFFQVEGEKLMMEMSMKKKAKAIDAGSTR